MNLRFAVLVTTVTFVSACEGVIITPAGGFNTSIGGTGGGKGGGGGAMSNTGGGAGHHHEPVDVHCDPTEFDGVRLEEIATEFSQRVHPDMLSATSGCVSCHSAENSRLFTVSADGVDTFYRARAAGFLSDAPGSILDRLNADDEATAMPKGAAAWSTGQIQEVAKISCMLRAFEVGGGVAADEQFPAELLMPFTGTKPTTYDNSFVNYLQLKGKVKAVFGDTWQRGGVDQWNKNIGLFGGANFTTHTVEARAATPEFLLGLDLLAPDVCSAAAQNKTMPFDGFDLTAPIIDIPASKTVTIEAESVPGVMNGSPSTNPSGFFCYSTCDFVSTVTLSVPGTYKVVVRAKAQSNLAGHPKVSVMLGPTSAAELEFTDDDNFVDKSATFSIVTPGPTAVTASFINDASNPTDGDRNIWFDYLQVIGPLEPSTGTTRALAAKARIDTLTQRMLFHPASGTEQQAGYDLVKDLAALGAVADGWAGLCEALVHHPDFLFTLPPSADFATGAAKNQALLVALTQNLVARPPKATELALLESGGFEPVIDALLASAEFQAYYFSRIQLRIETQGTAVSDEPARLWTWVMMNGKPFSDILTADYTVDETFKKVPRPSQHGRTGLLTMKGYVSNKPGLPHYNYPARVMSGFMGSIFEVPPEVFDQRASATASSTVDPTSICYSCHKLLTPLAHQRLKWDDNGDYRPLDMNGVAIDDSDRGLVATYGYKGKGLEAFSTKAVNKEAFIRRMINTQFKLLMGRDLRHADDERALYKTLWDDSVAQGGNLKSILKAVALSSVFQRSVP